MERRLLGVVVIILVAGFTGYYLMYSDRASRQTDHSAVAPPQQGPATVAAPALHYPVEPPAAPLPGLDESDAAFGAELAETLGYPSLPPWVYPDQMIRRIVATVDNLPRSRTSARLMPVQPVSGPFRVTGEANHLAIAPANQARYELYVGVMERVDSEKLADLYLRWYPLFQQAYVELGYPKGYFNDRLVEVMDGVLVLPEASSPPVLIQPHVLYEFADPDLEGLSAGGKIMMRMGDGNSARVKKALRSLRQALVARTAGRDRP